MTRTRSRNDKDVRMAGDHGQTISGGAGHSSGHAIQADGMPQTFRQGWYAMVMHVKLASAKAYGVKDAIIWLIVLTINC